MINHYYFLGILIMAIGLIFLLGVIVWIWKPSKMGWCEYAAKCSDKQFRAMIPKLRR